MIEADVEDTWDVWVNREHDLYAYDVPWGEVRNVVAQAQELFDEICVTTHRTLRRPQPEVEG